MIYKALKSRKNQGENRNHKRTSNLTFSQNTEKHEIGPCIVLHPIL